MRERVKDERERGVKDERERVNDEREREG